MKPECVRTLSRAAAAADAADPLPDGGHRLPAAFGPLLDLPLPPNVIVCHPADAERARAVMRQTGEGRG